MSEIEFNLIKLHSETGYEILKSIDFPWPIAQTLLQHHERLDGTGYPHGIQSAEFLLEAKILALADVVEAMISHRPCRAGLGVEAALEEIAQNRGIRYDVTIVDICIALFREKKFSFESR